MSKMNSYKLKNGITKEDAINYGFKEGGSWINKSTILYKSFYFQYKSLEISIYIGFSDDINNWDDFNNILILDEDFCQPYTPVYGEYYKKETDFDYAVAVIDEYNRIMDEIPLFERLEV